MNTERRLPTLNGTLLAAHTNMVNGHQMGELRALLEACVTAKNHHHMSLFDEDGKQLRSQLGPENDGGTLTAFDTTIIGILNRIDKTLEESWRWSAQLEAYAAAKTEVQFAQSLVEEQVAAAQHYGRPSVRFGAIITTHAGGGYVTYLRVSNDPTTGIIQGVGDTVEASMDAFDKTFTATTRTAGAPDAQTAAQHAKATVDAVLAAQATPTKGPPPKRPRTARKGGMK